MELAARRMGFPVERIAGAGYVELDAARSSDIEDAERLTDAERSPPPARNRDAGRISFDAAVGVVCGSKRDRCPMKDIRIVP